MQPTMKYLLLAVVLLFLSEKSQGCSAYKLTVGDKTMVGSNYDTWCTQPHIWFETSGYGAYFTGARAMGNFDFAPQTGMNVYGLAFVTLAAPSQHTDKDLSGLKKITNRSQLLQDVLHTCKNVIEVKAYLSQYDRSELNQEVLFYTDRTGHYLIAEPYELLEGNDDRYVQANFCPSTVSDISTIQQMRYVNGNQFVRNKLDTTLAFCTSLSDTMHVCRERFGDGTLLTSILDLKSNNLHLFFYHDYDHRVSFNLDEELKKGDHRIDLLTLFPANPEFEVLRNHMTPMNSPKLSAGVILFLTLFFVIALLMLISFLLGLRKIKYNALKLLIGLIALLMSWQMYVLGTQEGIYYFPAPYNTGTNSIINMAGYLPFAALLLIIPAFVLNYQVIRKKIWGLIPTSAFFLMNMMITCCIAGFMYWKFYDVF